MTYVHDVMAMVIQKPVVHAPWRQVHRSSFSARARPVLPDLSCRWAFTQCAKRPETIQAPVTAAAMSFEIRPHRNGA